jgi:hypothetical protein
MSWTLEELQAGQMELILEDGSVKVVPWSDGEIEPGWCKLDWVIADKTRGKLANASNMLDVTWEAPDGTIVPLDGFLDPYFQDVSAGRIGADLRSSPSTSRPTPWMTTCQLEEINKYVTKDVNYGKAAKRMYNVFRLTGRYEEAAYIRELFDEPATILYQVWSLIRTLDDATRDGASIPMATILAHADRLIRAVIDALDGDQEAEIVRQLLRLRDSLQATGSVQSQPVEAARAQVVNIVNNFFYERLTAVPSIKLYLDHAHD